MAYMNLWDWVEAVLGFLDGIWQWMTPGMEVAREYLPVFTPFLALIVASTVAFIGLWTFRLRVRVEHADQWWKREQYALELTRHEHQLMRRTAVAILQALVPGEPLEHASRAELKATKNRTSHAGRSGIRKLP
ncbi:hypothetical protein OK351_02275 [Glutamicibacter sp. MNS18]|uniref:hypothetical protein n=1 Tax=Glutamicibacter sp. MNS18 TaxID=2989817 RepID=UPI00223691BD|nr:hypothetical protein [Glutamicibacter sp. MNS18]MCW4464338.1 hypothetical protein [Glutamicibacter sp. MNS18]